ncbi:MAG: M81 family metallopeptidase [Pseudomonadota bacterium]
MPIAGFIREAGRRGHALVPLAWAMAVPCGRVTDDAFERISAMIVNDLAAQTPVDAVYLDLHGAAVIDGYEDGEGELLRGLRAVIGPDTVLVASLDLHANVTDLMIEQADLLTAYRTYPHVDTAETGARAAALLDDQLRGRARRGKALRKLPFLVPLTAQCSLVDPTRAIYDGFAAIEAQTGATLSFTPGFPPADIHDCGPRGVRLRARPGARRRGGRCGAASAARRRDGVRRRDPGARRRGRARGRDRPGRRQARGARRHPGTIRAPAARRTPSGCSRR